MDPCSPPPRAARATPRNPTPWRLAVLGALLLALLGGCEAPGPARPAEPVVAEAGARALIAEGRLAEAAAEYLRLAAAAADEDASGYRLKAAAALLDAGERDRAGALLDALERQALPPRAAAFRALLHADFELGAGRPERALELLAPEGAEHFQGAALRRYLALRARAHERTGNRVEEARDRIALEAMLGDEEARAHNRDAIWRALTRLTPAALERALIGADQPQLAAWLELASIAATSVTHPATLEQALAGWKARHPEHPGAEQILAQLRLQSEAQSEPPDRLALLLPLSGRFAPAARAVRDGFLAAWYADADNPGRPPVAILDTAADDPWVVYAAAVDAGARMVIGPLRREAVDTLAGSASRLVPTLALNRASVAVVPDRAAPFYQFALDPEEEARAVAERAWFDGHARALVLYPQGEWGERVASAFTGAFAELGGAVLDSVAYDGEARDMSAPVERLLEIDSSAARNLALGRRLGIKLGFETRRRQDADMVLLAAFPRQARQIRPQLQFHKAGGLPVYSTSHVFGASVDPARDRDVDGVSFGDMPWALEDAGGADPLRARVLAAWGANGAGFVRLYAFGADAYRLIGRLGRLRAQRFAEFGGATGRLSVDARGRVHRRLTWARFADGRPRLLDRPAPGP